MDVQASAPTLQSATFTLPPLPVTTGGASGSAPSSPPVSAPAAPSAPASGGSDPSLAPQIPATPGLSLLPPAPSSSSNGTPSLSSNVAKAYNVPEQSVTVSFSAAPGTNDVITTVTNAQTHQVLVQFPSETLIALAQFFQKLDSSSTDSGAVVDKKA